MPEQSSSISNFRRFLTRMLLPLILVISAGGYLFNYFFEQQVIFKSEIGGAYKVNRIIKETHADEIPIFGSSRAEGCYIPDSLGSNYFNYGLSGTKYDVTLFFVEEECKKQKNNPWILLNLDLDGLLYGQGDIANYIPNADYPPARALIGAEYKPYFKIPFVKYYGRFENYFRLLLSGKIELTKFTNKGAALEKNSLLPEQFNQMVRDRETTPTTFVTESKLKTRLRQTISRYSDRKFVFVVAPYHSSYFTLYENMQDAQRFIQELRSYKNVTVFDFSRLPMADSMFMNTTHINYKGATLFNRYLRDSIRAMQSHP